MSTRSHVHSWRAACALILLVTASSPELRADYQSDYRNGVRAFDRGRWSEAADAMRKAIAQNGSESATRINISGNRYLSYMPHFYLAASLARLGRCDEARQELALSEAAGVAQRFEAAAVRQIRDTCGPAPAPVLTASNPPAPAVDTTTRPAPQPVATETIADARPPAAPIQQPPVTTTTAAPTTTIAQIDPALETARRRLDSTLAEVRRALQTTPGTPAARAARTRLNSAVPPAAGALASSSPVAIARAADSLTAALSDYRAAIGTVSQIPQQLGEAVRAYAIGDYSRAVTLLAQPQAVTTYRAQVFLIRAASRFAQYVIAGERDRSMRDQVLADIREYRRLQPSGVADARLFSPRFRTLVAQATP